jgi:hypothetical protein
MRGIIASLEMVS